jgi:hypothetical protein
LKKQMKIRLDDIYKAQPNAYSCQIHLTTEAQMSEVDNFLYLIHKKTHYICGELDTDLGRIAIECDNFFVQKTFIDKEMTDGEIIIVFPPEGLTFCEIVVQVNKSFAGAVVYHL